MSTSSPTSLANLFPDTDYRFHLTLRRTSPAEFFGSRDPSGQIGRQRAAWLRSAPDRYAGVVPGGDALVTELATSVADWGVALHENHELPTGSSDTHALLFHLGAALEPDILLLSSDLDGRHRLRAGALCFPTGWALEEKLGQPLDVIHSVVPGLNAAVGAAVHQFLSKLKPGTAFLRDNWGVTASEELNLHPARGIAPPTLPVALDRLWLRVEHQALVALPRTGGILFGIRIALHRLDHVAQDPAAAGLRRALETMPPEVAEYKRIACILTDLVRLL